MKIEIVGYGWVGKAMYELFKDHHRIRIVDPKAEYNCLYSFEGEPDVAFICVPTPNKGKGALDCSIVIEAIEATEAQLVIIRSTVMPGFTEKMQEDSGKNFIFMPEYLGETVEHPLTNQKGRQFAIIGGIPRARREAIRVLQTVYNASLSIRQVDSTTAEVIKLSENRAIAFKVAQCQELYDACEAAGVDYYEVREAVYGDDPRFTLWFTMIYPEARGFNSKCIPKDVYGWKAWAESVGYSPDLTIALLETNKVKYLDK